MVNLDYITLMIPPTIVKAASMKKRRNRPVFRKAMEQLEVCIEEARRIGITRLAPYREIAKSAGVSGPVMLEAVRAAVEAGVVTSAPKQGLNIAGDSARGSFHTSGYLPRPPPGIECRNVLGIVFWIHAISREHTEYLSRLSFSIDVPVVVLNESNPELVAGLFSRTAFSLRLGTATTPGIIVANYLYRSGHRNITFISMDEKADHEQDRLDGLRGVWETFGESCSLSVIHNHTGIPDLR
jgi:hypothetical protein